MVEPTATNPAIEGSNPDQNGGGKKEKVEIINLPICPLMLAYDPTLILRGRLTKLL